MLRLRNQVIVDLACSKGLLECILANRHRRGKPWGFQSMPVVYKKEEVTVSFHYMNRVSEDGSTEIPISKDEFKSISAYLTSLIDDNFSNEQKNDQIRYRQIAVFQKVDTEGENYISGIYQGSYWGHAFKNSKAGKISADSINLRPFCFLLYLSESGRVYVCSQYLGTYGGYTALSNSIFRSFSSKKGIVSRSFNLNATSLEDADPKEVVISFSRASDSITSANKYGASTAIVLKSRDGNSEFPERMRQDFLRHANKPADDIKKLIAQVLKDQKLIELNDNDIIDCKMVLMQDGHKKTVSLFEPSHFATRFPANVDLDQDGHPKYEPMRIKMKEMLANKIIAKKENV